jgi:hypothetical protein
LIILEVPIGAVFFISTGSFSSPGSVLIISFPLLLDVVLSGFKDFDDGTVLGVTKREELATRFSAAAAAAVEVVAVSAVSSASRQAARNSALPYS